MRTSHSHPLQIAEVQASPGHGLIGITFCPGKKQPGALTGAWDRDLGIEWPTVLSATMPPIGQVAVALSSA